VEGVTEMNRIAQYQGGFLNHLEGIYRTEDRGLAIELAQALGLAVSEIQFTATSRPIIAAHPNAEDRDPTNNVFFLYEMPAVQRKVVDLLRHRVEADPELREAMQAYVGAARKAPPIMPHFGLRYRSPQALQAVMDKLEHGLSPELKARVALWEVPAYKPIEGLPDIRQIFVRTDVFFVGAASFEQAIELQVVRSH
jgi:hypothetical protein